MKCLKKNKMTKVLAISAALIAGSGTLATAQNAIEPWTGAVAGSNIQMPGDTSLQTIRRLLNEGKIDRAVNQAKRNVASIESESRSGKTTTLRYDAYNALCIALSAQQNHQEAIGACDEAIKDSPKRWMAYNSRGTANLRMGNYSTALNDYSMALNNAPGSSNIKSVLEHNMEVARNKSSN